MVRQEMPIETFGVDVRVTQRASVDSKWPQDGPPTALARHLGTSLHMRFFGPMRRGVVLLVKDRVYEKKSNRLSQKWAAAMVTIFRTA